MTNNPTTALVPVPMRERGLEREAFQPSNFEQAQSLAKTLVDSKVLPKAIDTWQKAFAVMMRGRELGLMAMQAMSLIHVIDGRTVMAAELMVGLVLDSGHCEYFDPVSMTNHACIFATKRRGSTREITLEWNMDMAVAAGLTHKDNWKKYPMAMLSARAKAALARAVYPDVVAGIYDQDEVDGPIIDVTPEPARPPTKTPMARSLSHEDAQALVEQYTAAVGLLGQADVDRIVGKKRGQIIDANDYRDAMEKIERARAEDATPLRVVVEEEPTSNKAQDREQAGKQELDRDAQKSDDGGSTATTQAPPPAAEHPTKPVAVSECIGAARAAGVSLAEAVTDKFPGLVFQNLSEDQKRALLAHLQAKKGGAR